MSDVEHSLLLAFDSDDARFVRGFEMGRLWTLVQSGDLGPHAVHADTAEMVIRIAEANDLTARCDVLDDLFIAVNFEEPA